MWPPGNINSHADAYADSDRHAITDGYAYSNATAVGAVSAARAQERASIGTDRSA